MWLRGWGTILPGFGGRWGETRRKGRDRDGTWRRRWEGQGKDKRMQTILLLDGIEEGSGPGGDVNKWQRK